MFHVDSSKITLWVALPVGSFPVISSGAVSLRICHSRHTKFSVSVSQRRPIALPVSPLSVVPLRLPRGLLFRHGARVWLHRTDRAKSTVLCECAVFKRLGWNFLTLLNFHPAKFPLGPGFLLIFHDLFTAYCGVLCIFLESAIIVNLVIHECSCHWENRPRKDNWIFFGWNEIQIIAELNSSFFFLLSLHPHLLVFQWSHKQVTQGTVVLAPLFSITFNQVLLILLSIYSSYPPHPK